ncbi:MAG: HAD family hydrolase [Deltaproteobacteria bacterium]|nr:MAG: HAD family hydrolase [Deltaproteobacteria bacterium]
MSRMLILDFDGTITDAELEGKPFRVGYLEDIAVLCGQPYEEVLAHAEKFEEAIKVNPDAHGWLYHGKIVAPASVDPYLRIMPVARMIFDHYGVFASEADRTRMLDGILYKYNYTKTDIAFKPDAREVLASLEGTATYVITNSHTESVQDKIRQLDDMEGEGSVGWLVDRVYGQAKKYMVDDTFEDVPEDLEMPGLSRRILLRRAKYFHRIDSLRKEVGAEWDEIMVAGDIFELDLALPLFMGATVGLVTNPFTPAYEKTFLTEHPRGRLINNLSEIKDWF